MSKLHQRLRIRAYFESDLERLFFERTGHGQDNVGAACIGQRFLMALRADFFRQLQGLLLEFFERRRLDDVLARLTTDIAAIDSFVLSGVVDAMSYGLRIAFFVGALFLIEWHLSLVVGAWPRLWLTTLYTPVSLAATSPETFRRPRSSHRR